MMYLVFMPNVNKNKNVSDSLMIEGNQDSVEQKENDDKIEETIDEREAIEMVGISEIFELRFSANNTINKTFAE